MLELPEVLTVSEQLNDNIVGRTVDRVLPPTKAHRFCWFNGDPADYERAVKGASIVTAEGFGIYVEIAFDNGMKLCFNDGVNARLVTEGEIPKTYQLAMMFTDGSAMVFTVAMYGGIILHDGSYDNEYYEKSRKAVSPLSSQFESYYRGLLEKNCASDPKLSAKGFLATGQRFPGIGNGTLQDILFEAGIHPRRKIASFSETEKDALLDSIISVLSKMTERGGRDTEKDMFGNPGGYRTLMSKNGMMRGCPDCGGTIVKEAYMGGSVYYCPTCQPAEK